MGYIQSLVLQNLSKDENLNEFAFWAFGLNYKEFDHDLQFMEAWNNLHADQLFLDGDNLINKDIPKMIALWRKNESQ